MVLTRQQFARTQRQLRKPVAKTAPIHLNRPIQVRKKNARRALKVDPTPSKSIDVALIQKKLKKTWTARHLPEVKLNEKWKVDEQLKADYEKFKRCGKYKEELVFHGTSRQRNVKSIFSDGFEIGPGQAFGRGIYATKNSTVAAHFSYGANIIIAAKVLYSKDELLKPQQFFRIRNPARVLPQCVFLPDAKKKAHKQ